MCCSTCSYTSKAIRICSALRRARAAGGGEWATRSSRDSSLSHITVRIGSSPCAFGDPRAQFSQLARYLFARYTVPAFMDVVWFRGDDEAPRQQGWFIHLGNGQNIRRADLPLTLSKKQTHHFLSAPKHYTAEEALRRAQALGHGGSELLADALISTCLGRSFADEAFWNTIVLFFIRLNDLDIERVGPIANYIYHHKFLRDGDEAPRSRYNINDTRCYLFYELKMSVNEVVPFFAVKNMQKALAFYIDGLGFELDNKWEQDGIIRWCYLKLNGVGLMLQQYRTEGHDSRQFGDNKGEGVSLCFFCDDAVAVYHTIIARGVDASEPQVGNGLWTTGMSDPDGYALSFQSPTDQAEETVLSDIE